MQKAAVPHALDFLPLLHADAPHSQVDDSLEEIDPSAILPTGRRTRGVKVDYTSEAALAKAGLKQGEGEEDDDEDTKMKD